MDITDLDADPLRASRLLAWVAGATLRTIRARAAWLDTTAGEEVTTSLLR